jgi:hypothetical protein
MPNRSGPVTAVKQDAGDVIERNGYWGFFFTLGED